MSLLNLLLLTLVIFTHCNCALFNIFGLTVTKNQVPGFKEVLVTKKTKKYFKNKYDDDSYDRCPGLYSGIYNTHDNFGHGFHPFPGVGGINLGHYGHGGYGYGGHKNLFHGHHFAGSDGHGSVFDGTGLQVPVYSSINNAPYPKDATTVSKDEV